ncbi:hypothetical protein M409DRAFT_50514 [Zasmidium cellare ATCC 36951]|uniref:FAD-binding PCMH-type domain-containing protein n=1 Tax=Zasmidium cellare ATCC 36951 TaxID=1080233 RepID=A0A6A6D0F1_ZASCE|nr:uncharacterized protein M409DRAFT_50514 [Zasmidium cellare ATCC 36951]KAF2171898.1 hypothetical protein M409DRAFT_50514 [Zasmidium cellare ATCC 36951]
MASKGYACTGSKTTSPNRLFPTKDISKLTTPKNQALYIQKHCPTISIHLSGQQGYTALQSGYWSSFQRDVEPFCFLEPTTPQDVAQILKILKGLGCPFAVKSGGHAAFAGASSAAEGFTVSLRRFREVSVGEDRRTTRVGTGNTWGEVYEELRPRGLGVVGGRVKNIGVGGLVLGGGISFFSGRYGWACDGVRNYELVTAEGEVLQVSQESQPDLYWALRGGGNQFGVVTRVDLETFEQGDLWGGTRVLLWEHTEALLDAFYEFAQVGAEADVDASMYLAFAYAPKPRDIFVASPFFTHAKGVEEPRVFREFLKLPHVRSTLRKANLVDLADELDKTNPNGLRESYWTHNFLLTREMLSEVTQIWKDEVETLKDVAGVLPALVLQPLTRNILAHFSRNGGNCLGLSPSPSTPSEPLLLMSVPTMWTDTSKDELVISTLRRMVERCVARSREVGAFQRFIYMNYAAREQRVFEGYGEGCLGRLRGVARKWDPEGVLRGQGGFGLWDGVGKAEGEG